MAGTAAFQLDILYLDHRLMAPCCHSTRWNHHPEAAIQIPSLACHDEPSENDATSARNE